MVETGNVIIPSRRVMEDFSKLDKGSLVFYTLNEKGKPMEYVAPDYKKTGNVYVARFWGIFEPLEDERKQTHLMIKPPVVLNLWDYSNVNEMELPGFDGFRIAGVKPYGDACIDARGFWDYALSPEEIKLKLVPALKNDRDLAVSRIEELAMKELIRGRYQRLIDAITITRL